MPTPLKLTTLKSTLKLGDGPLKLRLMQGHSNRARVGMLDGFEDPTKTVSVQERQAWQNLLATPSTSDLTVMSFHPAVADGKKIIEAYANGTHVVALAGRKDNFNVTYIASGAGAWHEQKKLSLASEDGDVGMRRGDELTVFEGDAGNVGWAVLNCHEYTHVDVMRALQDHNIELLVVVTSNPATRLYWEFARADVHRLFCFVVIANVGEVGGSGVFAPFRRIGTEQNAKLSAAGQLFGARGSAEVDVHIGLEIRYLRELRATYSKDGFPAKNTIDGKDPILPSQRYLATGDAVAAGPVATKPVHTERVAWNSSNPVVAFCQLQSLPLQTYRTTGYRLHLDTQAIGFFRKRLAAKLTELADRCLHRPAPIKLDFLVFPEVFVPRACLDQLVDFSARSGAIVIAGVDYPDENANECVIIRPDGQISEYRKITRSQYDAQGVDDTKPRNRLQRGDQLIRFENADGHTFGVLICYDYSHFELMEKINLEGRAEPLDLLFVVSHNPFGDLYRSCCIADSHRFYQHIVMCNVADYGGSGIFAPTREPGARQVLCEVGKGVEAIGLQELNLAKQRQARTAADGSLRKGRFMRKPGIFQERFVFEAPGASAG